MSNAIKTLVSKKEKLEVIRQQLNEEFKKEIAAVFTEFFKENPTVGMFVWNQFTPYFNDGEPCVFNVGDIYAYYLPTDGSAIDVGDLPLHSMSYGDDDGDNEQGMVLVNTTTAEYTYTNNKTTRTDRVLNETEVNTDEFLTALQLFNDEFEYAFGDHVVVVVTREGVDVEEFEHD